MAVRYGMFRICVLRTSHLEPYVPEHRTSVQFLKRTVPTYRSRTVAKKAYRTSVTYFLAKIEAYLPYLRTVPYCHPFFKLLATLTDFEITNL